MQRFWQPVRCIIGILTVIVFCFVGLTSHLMYTGHHGSMRHFWDLDRFVSTARIRHFDQNKQSESKSDVRAQRRISHDINWQMGQRIAKLQENEISSQARIVSLEKKLQKCEEKSTGQKQTDAGSMLVKCAAAIQGPSSFLPIQKPEMLLQELTTACISSNRSGTKLAAMRSGLINCWYHQNGSITDACLSLFYQRPNDDIGLHRKKLSEIQSTNAGTFDIVIDFDCDIWPGQAFHNVFDCLSKSLPLLLVQAKQHSDRMGKSPKVAAVIPFYLVRYMDIIVKAIHKHVGSKVVFFGNAKLNENSAHADLIDPTKGLVMKRGFRSWYIYRGNYTGSQGTWSKHPQSMLATRLFVSMIREMYHKPNQRCNKIVLIVRERDPKGGTRAIIDNEDLADVLKAHFGHQNILPYYGNESLTKTMRIFSKACAVIGFHGAGAVNIFFAPAGALFVEITTFQVAMENGNLMSDGWDLWRSNKYIVKGLDYVWDIKMVGLHHITPSQSFRARPKAVTKEGIDLSSPGQAVKNSDVLLTREHMDDVVSRVDRFLRCRQGHGIVYHQNRRKRVHQPERLSLSPRLKGTAH